MKLRYYLNESSLNESPLNENILMDKIAEFFSKIKDFFGSKTLKSIIQELYLIKSEYGDKPSIKDSNDIVNRIMNILKKNKNNFDEDNLSNDINESILNEDIWDFLRKHAGAASGAIGGILGGLSIGSELGFSGFGATVAIKGFITAITVGCTTMGIGALIGLLTGLLGGIGYDIYRKRKGK